MLRTRLVAAAGLALVIAVITAPVASAETDGDYSYTCLDGDATITGYTSSATVLDIPDELGMCKVVAIGDDAFRFSKLTELTLPDTLTSIGNEAFRFSNLTELTVGDSLISIGDDAFRFSKLTELTLPDTLTSIGGGAFYSSDFDSVTFRGAVATIGAEAFEAQTRSHYTFDGWFNETSEEDSINPFPSSITEATVLSPQHTADSQTVTFDPANGGAIPDATVDYGTNVSEPTPDPTLAGNTFVAWVDTDNNDAVWTFTNPVTTDLNLKATYALNTTMISGPSTATAGDKVTVSGSGFDPNEAIVVELHSTPVTILSTTADASGAFTGTATIPADTEAGAHQLVVASAAGVTSTDIVIEAVVVPPVEPTSSPEPTEPSPEPTEPSPEPTSPDGGEELAETGPLNASGITGLALLLVVAGAGLIATRRRIV